MDELISVIVPVYNVEKYLNRCLSSIVAQTYRNLEIILVDNGSSDHCPELCDKWMEQDSRFRVIHMPENRGIGAARNTGMEAARGELWMFVDSDDYLPVDAIQVLHERIKNNKCDLAIGKHLHTYPDGRTNGKMCKWMTDCVISSDEILENTEGHEYPVCLWGKLYRRFVLEDITVPPLICGEDLWVFPQILQRCRRICLVNQYVYYYYQRPDSIMHQKSEARRTDEFRATLHMAQSVLGCGYPAAARRWLDRAIMQGMEISNRKAAKAVLCQSLNASERKKLSAGLSLKRRISLASIFTPGLFAVIRLVTGRHRGNNS